MKKFQSTFIKKSLKRLSKKAVLSQKKNKNKNVWVWFIKHENLNVGLDLSNPLHKFNL